ncbi:MAG: T9SS type A sorting domain-containing protein [Saprospiraceae bacterium]
MKSIFKCMSFRLLVIIGLLIIANLASADVIYVNITAIGLNNGTSWTDAFTDLQNAINVATPIDEIWVAQGTYLPTETQTDTFSRRKTFYINKGMKLYGGFEGIPGTENDFTARDFATHPTILSGDIGQEGVVEDNAYHVMWLDHVGFGLHIDGFRIVLGYGFDPGSGGTSGAGIYNDGSGTGSSSPFISNCTFDQDKSFETAGAFFNFGSEAEAHPVLMNCVFTNNSGSGGGAITNMANPAGDASPVIINCSFKGNSGPTAGGGAIQNIALSAGSASPQLYNCLFTGNFSPNSAAFASFASAGGVLTPLFINCTFSGNFGGGISTTALGGSIATPTVRNSIFWANSGGGGISENGATTTVTYSLVPFGLFPGEGNVGLDPFFVNTPDFKSAPTITGDVHLTEGSIAIDAGDNSALTIKDIPTDLDGHPRVFPENGTVDMGVYEFKTPTSGITETALLSKWSIAPNPASNNFSINVESNSIGWMRMFDANGKLVFQKFLGSGITNESISADHIPAGTYFMQILINGATSTRKLLIDKN